MKFYWGLILLAISTAFGAGYYALFLQGSYQITAEDVIRIRHYKQVFLDKNQPVSTLNLSDYYPYREQRVLISPPKGLRASSKNFATYSSSKNCFSASPFSLGFGNFQKTIVWEEFRCGARSQLPSQFFTSPPYMHPSGKSFMYLAYKLDPKVFGTWSWLHSRIYFFHLEELYELSPKWKAFTSSPLSPLLSLGQSTLYKMSRNKSPLVRDNLLYLKRTQTFFSNENLTYDVFKLSSLKTSISNTEFSVRKRENNENCFYNNQELCWSYNLKYLFSIASKGSLVFFIFSLIIILIALWLFFNKLRGQRLEDERRRLALQVLSHEFRTPVASLLLTVESLLNSIDNVDEKIQGDILRVSSDTHRLHRLVELSRHYLKVSNGKRLVDLKQSKHNSFNQLISNLLIRYEDQISVKVLETDTSICIDEYWLGICLKNLVENALKHGITPIEVEVRSNNKEHQILIKDSGSIPCNTDLDSLTQEFAKGTMSEGSGLGLNIVAKIIKDMKGKLELIKDPTTFVMTIPNKHQEK